MAKYTPEELKRRKRRRIRKKMLRLAVMGIFVIAMAFGMVRLVEGMIVPKDTAADAPQAHSRVHVQQPNTDISKQMDKWYGFTGDVAQTINLLNDQMNPYGLTLDENTVTAQQTVTKADEMDLETATLDTVAQPQTGTLETEE